jgi:hypothetical protein
MECTLRDNCCIEIETELPDHTQDADVNKRTTAPTIQSTAASGCLSRAGGDVGLIDYAD